MPRHGRSYPDPDDSDASFSPDGDEVFDVDDSEDENMSAATSVKDFYTAGIHDQDLDEIDDVDAEVDVEDQIQLFGGNLHPPEYYIQSMEVFNQDDYESEDYKEGTTRLINSVEEQWFRFCKVVKHPDSYSLISICLLYKFFEWRLNQKSTPDGRRLRGIKKRSSLGTYWKVFRLAYERAVADKVDPKLNRSMHKVLRSLAKKHGLSDERRANRCMTVDQLEGQIETTLSTTKKSFRLGEMRIYAVLFLLLLAPAGARPTSILRLRFGDLRIMLERDPEGGPHNTLVKFTLAFTKSYLGEKAKNTYPLPETLGAASLFLNTHVFLLGIVFRHRAFLAPSLTSPHLLKTLNIHPNETELQLPLKTELDKVFVFRRAVRMLTGYVISDNEPISYGMVAGWTKRCGELLGLAYGTIPYNLRYNAANEWTASVDISDDLRNLAMDHANSIPLRKHYLGHEINRDIGSIIRGTRPQHALVQQSCSVGHSMSKRRPVDLTPEQSASINAHPRIRRLTLALRRLPRASKKHRETVDERRKEKQRLRRELKRQIRHAWTDEQAVDDVERQLQGFDFAPVPADTAEAGRPPRPAQKRLIKALKSPPATDLEGQYQRRDNAIVAVMAYCTVEEGCTVPRRYTASPKHGHPLTNQVDAALLSVFIKDEEDRPRRCFVCVGKACSLPPEDPLVQELIHEFFMPGDVTKHLRRKHSGNLKEDESSVCPACDMKLDHKMHLKAHALKIHGTVP
ncbi:C2H2 finger domain-containing protein [Apiospora arundinis]|uniref:C2H2 finger domain-containing protein n=1 Tax=Apiospora arundinis TaxID=335852 RepID=A0ABR2I8Z6_9PEZI